MSDGVKNAVANDTKSATTWSEWRDSNSCEYNKSWTTEFNTVSKNAYISILFLLLVIWGTIRDNGLRGILWGHKGSKLGSKK